MVGGVLGHEQRRPHAERSAERHKNRAVLGPALDQYGVGGAFIADLDGGGVDLAHHQFTARRGGVLQPQAVRGGAPHHQAAGGNQRPTAGIGTTDDRHLQSGRGFGGGGGAVRSSVPERSTVAHPGAGVERHTVGPQPAGQSR